MDNFKSNEFSRALEAFSKAQQQIVKAYGPTIMLQERLGIVLEPLKEALSSFNYIYSQPLTNASSQIKVFNEEWRNSFQIQTDILSKLSAFNVDILNTNISINSSAAFNEAASTLVAKLDSVELPEELTSSKKAIESLSQQDRKMTWEQIITIILFIYATITFIKDVLPDKHEKKMEAYAEIYESNMNEITDCLQQLTSIESKELELLEKEFQ